MYELTHVIPDANVLLALEPEELGAKLLFLLRRRNIPNDMFMPSNLMAEIWPNIPLPGQQHPYPTQRRSAINQALTEAWAWLEAQGLIVPAPDSNGPLGWKVLSRRAKKFENEEEISFNTDLPECFKKKPCTQESPTRSGSPSCEEILIMLSYIP